MREWSYDGKIEPVLLRTLTADEMEKMKEKLRDPGIERTIDHEVEMGNSRRVISTPTIFVTLNGKEQRLVGGLPYSVMKE